MKDKSITISFAVLLAVTICSLVALEIEHSKRSTAQANFEQVGLNNTQVLKEIEKLSVMIQLLPLKAESNVLIDPTPPPPAKDVMPPAPPGWEWKKVPVARYSTPPPPPGPKDDDEDWQKSLVASGLPVPQVPITLKQFSGVDNLWPPTLVQIESDKWETETFPTNNGLMYTFLDDRKILPNPAFTPGAIFKEATLDKIKQPNYSKTVRNVPISEHKKVFERYKIDYAEHAKYEVDHLVPLSWGGSNDVTNLWPQLYEGEWGAHKKDALEVHGLKLIREGKLEQRAACKEIADDWHKMYMRVMFEPISVAIPDTWDQ